MIPIIHYLLQFQCQILLAATGAQKKLLEAEFPGLTFLSPPEYDVKYNAKNKQLTFDLFRQIPRLIRVIHHERVWVNQMVKKHQVDAIISDNRYGFRSNKAYSVIITHQVAPKSGFFQPIDNILKHLHVKFLRRFHACWVPDAPGSVLSGALSGYGQLPPGFHFIGPLSRFAGCLLETGSDTGLLVMLSGPEPARTHWENTLLPQLRVYPGEYLLVRGLPGNLAAIPEGVNHLPADKLQSAIRNASMVICRSGYSSIMDLVALGSPALLVPTPGQTEQEYLAAYLSSKGLFLCATEDQFVLPNAIETRKALTPTMPELDFFRFRSFIDELISRLNHTH